MINATLGRKLAAQSTRCDQGAWAGGKAEAEAGCRVGEKTGGRRERASDGVPTIKPLPTSDGGTSQRAPLPNLNLKTPSCLGVSHPAAAASASRGSGTMRSA